MMGRTMLVAGWAVFAQVSVAAPQYACKSLGSLGTHNYNRKSIHSFTTGDRISLIANLTFFLHQEGSLINLTDRWKRDTLSPQFVNDRGQFSGSDLTSISKFKPNIDAKWQFLHPIGDYADSVYSLGMTEDYVFGAQRIAGDNRFAEPWTYNTVTGQYRTLDPRPYGYVGAEIQSMNESGDMLIRFSSILHDKTLDLSGNMYIFRNGAPVANLGNMRYGSMNSKGQAVGCSFDLVTGVYSTTFWDGTKLQVMDPDLNVSGNTPMGLSDDGTIVVLGGGEDRFSSIFKDGRYYSFAEVCPGLPAGMKIYGAKIRPDGAIAGVGVLGNETYLMRFDPVPEPASLLVVGGGLCALVSRRRLRPGS